MLLRCDVGHHAEHMLEHCGSVDLKRFRHFHNRFLCLYFDRVFICGSVSQNLIVNKINQISKLANKFKCSSYLMLQLLMLFFFFVLEGLNLNHGLIFGLLQSLHSSYINVLALIFNFYLIYMQFFEFLLFLASPTVSAAFFSAANNC